MAIETTITNRVDKVFARCRAEGRAALVVYLTCGFPNEEITHRVLRRLQECQVELIELGVPFSDPIADGPVIQHASTIALSAGMSYPRTLDVLREFRRDSQVPVILFGALNPFLRRGIERAVTLAGEAGADGILAADLPVEEADELRSACHGAGLHLVNLIAPTTPAARMKEIVAKSTGFVYCIALRGVTGERAELGADTIDYIGHVKALTSLPVALGFGISRPEHVRAAVDAGADAIVVGSALIRTIQESCERNVDVEDAVEALVESLKSELKRR